MVVAGRMAADPQDRSCRPTRAIKTDHRRPGYPPSGGGCSPVIGAWPSTMKPRPVTFHGRSSSSLSTQLPRFIIHLVKQPCMAAQGNPRPVMPTGPASTSRSVTETSCALLLGSGYIDYVCLFLQE
ncbi:hypothetical protein Dimus_028574 [Dionaea muscipula]